jgi:hypothetical protein
MPRTDVVFYQLADFLRDGIYELRIRRGRVNYRIL